HFFGMFGVKTPDNVWFLADCLSGDPILEKYHIPFIYDVAAYLQTLERVKALSAALFVPAHAAAVREIAPLADRNIAKVREVAERILTLCAEPKGFEELLAALFGAYGLTMDFNQYVLVGSTVRSYLSWLHDDGRLHAEFSENRLLWSAV
ncbi:MAG: MBL fold metallo-hydrolase, partial [Oscillospiraceae bacterium]